MNFCAVVGNLGKDVDLQLDVGENKIAIAEFPLATSEYRGGKNITEWHSIKVFGKHAIACGKYLAKGSKVAITGRISTRSWDKDGTRMYRTSIVADRVEFLSKSGETENTVQTSSKGRPVDENLPNADNIESMGANDINDKDLPF